MVNIKCKSLVFLVIWSMLMISVVISTPLLMDNAPLTAEDAGFQGAGARGCNGGGPGARTRPTSSTGNATTASATTAASG